MVQMPPTVEAIDSLPKGRHRRAGLRAAEVRRTLSDVHSKISLWQSTRALAAYLLLPNLTLIVASRIFDAERQVINVDYLAAGIVEAFFGIRAGVTAFAISFATDLVL